MTGSSRPQVVVDYLDRLRAAFDGVPREVSRPIIAGIVKELEGLDTVTAAERIRSMRDPALVAADARSMADGIGRNARLVSTPRFEPPRRFVVVLCILIAIGDYYAPMLSVPVGGAMLLVSIRWRSSERFLLAISIPVSACVAVIALLITGHLQLTGSVWWQLLIVSLILAFLIGGLLLVSRVLRKGR